MLQDTTLVIIKSCLWYVLFKQARLAHLGHYLYDFVCTSLVLAQNPEFIAFMHDFISGFVLQWSSSNWKAVLNAVASLHAVAMQEAVLQAEKVSLTQRRGR